MDKEILSKRRIELKIQIDQLEGVELKIKNLTLTKQNLEKKAREDQEIYRPP